MEAQDICSDISNNNPHKNHKLELEDLARYSMLECVSGPASETLAWDQTRFKKVPPSATLALKKRFAQIESIQYIALQGDSPGGLVGKALRNGQNGELPLQGFEGFLFSVGL